MDLNRSLANAILARDFPLVKNLHQQGASLSEIDPYGLTPIVEAAIADSLEIAQYLLQHAHSEMRADDLGQALNWAVDNNNLNFTALLLRYGADPNFYTVDGKPVLAQAIARGEAAIVTLLGEKGANFDFAHDYLTAKLIGHRFELTGRAEVASPENKMLVVGFEGFYPEITLGLVRDSLTAYINHFAAREAREFKHHFTLIAELLNWACQARKLKHFNAPKQRQSAEAKEYAERDNWILPVTSQGHAFTLVRFKNYFAICDRRQDTPVDGKVILYQLNHPERLTVAFIHQLLYQISPLNFFEVELVEYLGLTPKVAFPTHSQLAGNCSWANVEVTVLVLLYALLEDKEKALALYEGWREWDKDRALNDAMYDFPKMSKSRQACRVSLLAAVLFQRLDPAKKEDVARAMQMKPYLDNPAYKFVLASYWQVYGAPAHRAQYQKFFTLLKKVGLRGD